jgi:hypothetical protein
MKNQTIFRKRSALWILLTTALSFSSLSLVAQTETDTTFRTQMNYAFANLDKSKVPNGILRDYAMEFINLEYFNGTAPLADSNYAHAASFWQVYNTLISGRIHSSATGFLRGDTLDNRWYNSLQDGKVTLSGLYFLYSRFKDNAYPTYITITQTRA